MGYQMWCQAVRSSILATGWLHVFIFCFFGVLLCRSFCTYIIAVLSPVSVIGQGYLVNNRGHTHIA